MVHSFGLRIQTGSGAVQPEIRVEIPDVEWQNLLLFVEYADQLGRTQMAQGGTEVRYGLRFSIEDGLLVESSMPDEDYVSAFLHRMRPFVLQQEPTWFYHVCNVLSRRIEHASLRGFIKQQKERYAGKAAQSLIQISSNGVPLNAEETVVKWLNAYEYHRDADKQKYLREIHRLLPMESSRVLFVSVMIEKAKAVFAIADLIRFLGGETEDTIELQA